MSCGIDRGHSHHLVGELPGGDRLAITGKLVMGIELYAQHMVFVDILRLLMLQRRGCHLAQESLVRVHR